MVQVQCAPLRVTPLFRLLAIHDGPGCHGIWYHWVGVHLLNIHMLAVHLLAVHLQAVYLLDVHLLAVHLLDKQLLVDQLWWRFIIGIIATIDDLLQVLSTHTLLYTC